MRGIGLKGVDNDNDNDNATAPNDSPWKRLSKTGSVGPFLCLYDRRAVKSRQKWDESILIL